MEQPIARCEDRVGKEGYTKGSAGVVTAGKAMLRLLKAEHVLSHSVFPTGSALPSQALSQTVASTAQLFLLSAVQSTVGRIRKSLARAEFNDSLALFDLLESCTEVLREPGNVADAVSDAGGAGSDVWEGLGAATVTGAMFLRRFATETKAESDRGVPADGTVSELTSNVGAAGGIELFRPNT